MPTISNLKPRIEMQDLERSKLDALVTKYCDYLNRIKQDGEHLLQDLSKYINQ